MGCYISIGQSKEIKTYKKEKPRVTGQDFIRALKEGNNEKALKLFLAIAEDRDAYMEYTEIEELDDETIDWYWLHTRYGKDDLYYSTSKTAIGSYTYTSPDYCLQLHDISDVAKVAFIYAVSNGYYDFVKMAADQVKINNLMGLYSEYLFYAEGRMKDLLMDLGAHSLDDYQLIIVDYGIFYLTEPEQEEMVNLIIEMYRDDLEGHFFSEAVIEDLKNELGLPADYASGWYATNPYLWSPAPVYVLADT